MPKRTDEEWRFADLKKLQFDDYVDAAEIRDEVAADLITRSVRSRRTQAASFRQRPADRRPDARRRVRGQGVIFKPLSQALDRATRIWSAPLSCARTPEARRQEVRRPCTAPVCATVSSCTCRRTSSSRPVEVFHWLGPAETPRSSRTASSSRALARKRWSLSMSRRPTRTDGGFCCGVADLVAGEGLETHLRPHCRTPISEQARSVQINWHRCRRRTRTPRASPTARQRLGRVASTSAA